MPAPLPVHVISLRRRADRRAWIAENLRRVGLTFAFFDATDARDLGHDPLAHLYNPAHFAAHNPGHPEPSPGAVASSLSHYRLWQQVADSGVPWTLILEDDAVFADEDPRPLLAAASAAAGPQDVVLLNSRCRGVWRRGRVALPQKPYVLYRVNAEARLAAAYLLSSGAAQRLAAAVARDGLLCVADWWYSRKGADWSRLVPVRVVKPDPVAQHAGFESDIVTAQNDDFDWIHDDAHRSLPLSAGIVRAPRNPRYWPLFVSRWLRRRYGYYCVPPRCLEQPTSKVEQSQERRTQMCG